MKALIQRVACASVNVGGNKVSAIGRGMLVLLAVEKGDSEAATKRMVERVLSYRVFDDPDGKMNLDLLQTNGELLVVSQFTLAADTGKGRRPSFSSAAEPGDAEQLYELFLSEAGAKVKSLSRGIFGADMQISLVNDGPVTFLIEV